MAIQRCPYCKSIIDDKAEYCLNCGTRLIVDDEIFKEDIPGEKISADTPESTLEPEAGDREASKKKEAARSRASASKKRKKEKKSSASRKKKATLEEPLEEVEVAGEDKQEEGIELEESQLDQPEFSSEPAGEAFIFGEDESGKEEEPESIEEEISTEELLENITSLEEESIESEDKEEELVALDEEREVSEEIIDQDETEKIGSEEQEEVIQEREKPLFEEETLDTQSTPPTPIDFKTEDLEKLIDPAEKEKEEIERFLESLKKEREEKRRQAEKTTGLPPWATGLKEGEKGVEVSFPEEETTEPSIEEEVEPQQADEAQEQPLFPLAEEPSTPETVGFPETVSQTGFSFVETKEKKFSWIEFPRKIPFLSWLKALAFDLFFIAFFWVVAVLVTSFILKVNFMKLVLLTPWKMLALYLIFLGVYFLLFLIFIGETLGRQLFPSAEE
ncbi:hypothetical protein NLC35_02025 [Candidatus Aminicenantes bacterium AC-334-K16]|nr:hypothetical protein [Candidatus Aminicenantes bacterium AC-334-K16]